MAVHSVQNRAASHSLRSLGAALSVGAAVGGAVSLAAFYVARYGPTGDGWSFRGNGALAVYALVPAAIAAGWTAAVLQHRGQAWLWWSLLAGLVGTGLAALDAALLPLFGTAADTSAGRIVLLALLVWTLAAPATALRFPAQTPGRRVSAGLSLATAAVWLGGVIAGLAAVGLVFPAGS